MALVFGLFACAGESVGPVFDAPGTDAGLERPVDRDAGSTPSDGSADAGAVATTDAGTAIDAGTSANTCDPFSLRVPEPQAFIAPTGLQNLLLSHINAATTSLSLMMYQLTLDAFTNAFIAAHRRGVSVRVMLDMSQAANNRARDALQAAGVPWKAAPTEFEHNHAKVLIIDRREAIVMSANLIGFSMGSERNYGVINTNADDIVDLEAIFDRDWTGSGALDLSCTRLVVSPVNARDRLLNFFNGATQTLDIAVMYLSDRDFVAVVKARKAAGVSVRVLLADPDWIGGNRATATDLGALGIPVKFLKTVELHAKLVIADGVPFVGSQNYSWTSITKNREIGLFVTEATPRAAITAQFEADWRAGVTP
ncbi:MAG: hypothetical protein HYY84_00255 [Deltaproteobacteria bacterium]|nr:hypothetical protein [Deltaproteobacteria bacterium]